MLMCACLSVTLQGFGAFLAATVALAACQVHLGAIDRDAVPAAHRDILHRASAQASCGEAPARMLSTARNDGRNLPDSGISDGQEGGVDYMSWLLVQTCNRTSSL